ncbi:Conserved DNA-binding protein YbaB [Sanguibacter gelidistatuariae]|uniref:Conserved DNA-binding protein YbaB n=1 Tax=Sanguibacter gelidistatuariae TaxID=1814289 RepID=A0A1G6GQI9_9MICO|nr:YbaB/EbfC family nucleoid-associated protein [Sanguibacter gelidistatuariae]SDB83466.1 Conserved DNA-binding protein YbaB [Sanguibacter gelidistatuariae]
MSDDRTEDLAVIREELDRKAQLFETASTRAKGAFTGQDASGLVKVTVTDDGKLREVQVSNSWSSSIEPEALGGSILEAHTNAGLSRMEQWGNAMAEEADRGEPPLRPVPPLAENLSARLDEVVRDTSDPAQTEATLQALAALLTEINDSIDTVSADVTALQQSQVSGRSDSGHVDVVLSGTGDLQEIRFDQGWLPRAHPMNINREILNAHDKSLRSLAGRSVADLLAQSPLGKLQALADDPVALADLLRLR